MSNIIEKNLFKKMVFDYRVGDQRVATKAMEKFYFFPIKKVGVQISDIF